MKYPTKTLSGNSLLYTFVALAHTFHIVLELPMLPLISSPSTHTSNLSRSFPQGVRSRVRSKYNHEVIQTSHPSSKIRNGISYHFWSGIQSGDVTILHNLTILHKWIITNYNWYTKKYKRNTWTDPVERSVWNTGTRPIY